MICIYHNKDLDGFCSGAIVKKKYPDAVMIGYDYGELFDVESIPEGEPVIMVDVSMTMNVMFEIARRSDWQFTWIDHHKSAIEDYEKYRQRRTLDGLALPMYAEAVLRVGVGACELAWEFFFPEIEMPLAVSLLGKYDTWREFGTKGWGKEIYPFQMGMRLYCNSVESFPVRLLADMSDNALFIAETMGDGATVIRYQKQYAELICRAGAFEAVFEGLDAICLNAGGMNSESVDSIYDYNEHDIIIYFFWQKSFWKVSLYTKKDIDVSVIAKRYGGGGHKAAAGFEAHGWHIDKNKLQFTGVL